MKHAEMLKTIYSLPALRELLVAANRRYLEFLSAIADDIAGTDQLRKISQPAEENGCSYSGFNFFADEDQELFEVLAGANSTSVVSSAKASGSSYRARPAARPLAC